MLVSLSAPLLLELRKCRSHEGPFRRPRVVERSHAPSSNKNLRCTVNSDAKCSVPGQAPTTPHVLPSFPTTSVTIVGFTREKKRRSSDLVAARGTVSNLRVQLRINYSSCKDGCEHHHARQSTRVKTFNDAPGDKLHFTKIFFKATGVS